MNDPDGAVVPGAVGTSHYSSRVWFTVGRRYSLDDRQSWADLDARDSGLGVWVADVPGSVGLAPGQAVDFRFWWPEAGRWEGRDLRVEVSAASDHPDAPGAARSTPAGSL